MPLEWDRIVVEEDLGVIEVHADGRMQHGLNIATSNRGVEKIRTGYRCINCMEPFESAWPKHCNVCSFPVADKQAEQFARVYAGYDPTMRVETDWEAAADRLEERKERRAWAKRARESRIVLGSKSIGESLKRMGR